jgi:hypothetical protein
MQNNSKAAWFKMMAATAGIAMSAGAFATGSGGDSGFSDLLDRASEDGSCSVSRVSVGGSTLYIPRDNSNSNARFNVLVWGNGTGGTSSTYRTLLTSVASHCIAVTAANTDNSGTGREMEDAYESMKSRYSNILRTDHTVCTAGHSQGGGGSFNAANRIDADCAIPVQPDTRFTITIYDDLASDVEVITLWGEDDTLAPASGNRRNVESNSSILTQVETSGEGHFAPTSGRGGIIGNLFRMANIAQLSNDPTLATEFRGAFWGPTTDNTASEDHSDISDVRKDSGATSTNP